jgi:MFS family permease
MLQIYGITRASLAVGVLGIARAVPAIGVGLLGGSVAGAMDRRRLALASTGSQAAASGLLAAQAFADLGQLWLLYALVALQSSLRAVSGPAARTFIPRLLPAGQVPAGLALNQLTGQVMLVAGPALAGLLTATGSCANFVMVVTQGEG